MQGGIEIYFLLLLAVIAGWILGRVGRRAASASSSSRVQKDPVKELFADYFVGLNYLLNDEPDEAIDTFINALEINSETIETHLALGALLRRRGKVDKAIRVHQILLARPGMPQHFIDATRLQLATDYIAAGLLDRAERLLNEILEEGTESRWDALNHLITIYQTEKEWHKAVDASRQLFANSGYQKDKALHARAAHYCCEIAQEQFESRRFNESKDWIKKAFAFDRRSIRATLLLADIEQRLGNHRAALRELLRVCKNDVRFAGHVLPALERCYEQLEERRDYERTLRELLGQGDDEQLVLALTRQIHSTEGEANAIQFLGRQLEKSPHLAGLLAMLRLQIPMAEGELKSNLHKLQSMLESVLSHVPHFRCEQCGYEEKSLSWLCPSCKQWDGMKPVANSKSN